MPGAVIASTGFCLSVIFILGLIVVGFLANTEITRVKIVPSDDEGIAAYASITIDHCFIIHGLRLTHSKYGYFLFMPGKKRADGTYVDIVHPLNNETRKMIQEKVVEYERIIGESVK